MDLLADMVGGVGVACFLIAYFLLQKEAITANSGPYLALNLAGAVLIMLSLLAHWNLPAFLLEAAWAMITLYGMYKHLYLPRRHERRD